MKLFQRFLLSNVFSLLFSMLIVFGKANGQSFHCNKCKLLKNIVQYEDFTSMFFVNKVKSDTIYIVDTTNFFSYCNDIIALDKPVAVTNTFPDADEYIVLVLSEYYDDTLKLIFYMPSDPRSIYMDGPSVSLWIKKRFFQSKIVKSEVGNF